MLRSAYIRFRRRFSSSIAFIWLISPRHSHSDQWRSHGSISDTFGASRKFRVLAVIDDCTRENLALIADTSLSGTRVARELTTMIRLYGQPDCIVSDNGTEFTSTAILKCPYGD